jgi:hypothetical protein
MRAMKPILSLAVAALLISQVSNAAAQPQQDTTPALSPVEGTWLSNWGPVTFVPQLQADGIHIRGFEQQWPSQKGTITDGHYDPEQRKLTFSYFQE